jgi:DNA mismatch repair protein MSH2
VINQHVSAALEDDRIVFLYEVAPGACDKSFGVHVAGIAGFPKEIVEVSEQSSGIELNGNVLFLGSALASRRMGASNKNKLNKLETQI